MQNGCFVGVKNSNFKNPKMSDGGHFKNVQSPYLHNRSTDFDEIWHDDACWPFKPNVNLKFLIVDNPAASKFSGITE